MFLPKKVFQAVKTPSEMTPATPVATSPMPPVVQRPCPNQLIDQVFTDPRTGRVVKWTCTSTCPPKTHQIFTDPKTGLGYCIKLAECPTGQTAVVGMDPKTGLPGSTCVMTAPPPPQCPEGQVLMETTLPTGEKVKQCVKIETEPPPVSVPTPPGPSVPGVVPRPPFTVEEPTIVTLPKPAKEEKGWPWWYWLLLAGGVAGTGAAVYYTVRRK